VKISVRIPASLRSWVGGEAVLAVDVGPGDATVADVLAQLASDHVALHRRVCDERGHVRTHVNVFVGQDNVRDLDGLATPVPPGADVTVLPAVSGGA